ncbi:MAG: hypothetical protein QF637_08510 [Acidimicrobiales bacterium]|nr:hypothetical protein [Acidimicrobiales bacterium]
MTSEYDAEVPDPSEQAPNRGSFPQSFEIPSALPSVTARVLAFAAILTASVCGGLMGFALGRLQWGATGDAWVFIAACLGSIIASTGVGVVSVLVLRAMAEWSDVASIRARRNR